MISRCVKVPFPKILIFLKSFLKSLFKYSNSPISFWPWSTDLVIIFLSVLFCIHFLFYNVRINGSLFLLTLWTSQNPYLILLPYTCLVKHPPNYPPFFDILTGLWKYHTTNLFRTQQSQPLIWNIGNFTSSLSIPASLLHLHYSETSESSSWLSWFSTYDLTTYLTEKTETWERISFAFLLQSPNILWLLILPFIFDSCVIGRGSLLSSGKNILRFCLLPNSTSLITWSLSLFSVNSFSPCFFQWGLRWPQASSLKII